MERTIEALTTKEKVKMESRKERERQMEAAPGELSQRDTSFSHIFFFLKYYFLGYAARTF